MKAFLYSLLALVILAGVCVVTCPDKQAHIDEMQEIFNQTLFNELNEGNDDQSLAAFGSLLTNSTSSFLVKNSLKVDNYFLFSIGRLEVGNESHPLTFGILNHVFSPSEEQMKEAMLSAIGE